MRPGITATLATTRAALSQLRGEISRVVDPHERALVAHHLAQFAEDLETMCAQLHTQGAGSLVVTMPAPVCSPKPRPAQSDPKLTVHVPQYAGGTPERRK